MKFMEVREQWWTGQVFDKREITLYRKSETIRCHIVPYFDDKDIDAITNVDINLYIQEELEHGNHLTGGPLCANSINKALEILNGVFTYAKNKGIIRNNPMDLVKRLKRVPSKKYYVYTPREVKVMIEAARPKWLGDMILLSYHTGMRKEEIFGLQWSDIDFEFKSLTVNQTIVAISPHEYFINGPKSRTSQRTIMFDKKIEEMFLKRKVKATCEWVFEDKYGKEMNPWYTVKYFRKTLNKVGIESGRFHDLRHTHITELVDAGLPLPVIQYRAGHSDINMTMRYTHIAPGMQQIAVDFLNKRDAG